MIDMINEKYGLDGVNKIKMSTVRSRVDFKRRNAVVNHIGNTSPLVQLESVAVELLIKCGEMNQPLTCDQGLELIRSLVLKDSLRDEILGWIRSNCNPKADDEFLIGKGYWRNFLRRNKFKLKSKKGKLFPQSRDDWCTAENFKEMYDRVYEKLIESGVAEKLHESVYMDREGNIVNQEASFGLKVDKKIIHPDYFLHVDEFGDNLDMTKDKTNGGQKYVVGSNQNPNIAVSSNNLHYTVLGFTASNGQPVMCAIILTREDVDSSDGVKLNVAVGIDVLSEVPIDVNNLKDSFSEDGAFCGGPKCIFHGKEVPCYVTTSQKGGMNSKILTSLFKYMDDLDLFPRVDGGPFPTVLIDGHGSRFGLEFLSYINNPNHLWYVCLGVPYGTHKWQVADSEEQNGAMRCSIGQVKRDRLLKKIWVIVDYLFLTL